MKFWESLITHTPLIVCGNIQQNASPCGRPSATSLLQPFVESPLPHAGDVTLPVLPSVTSGVSHHRSEICPLSVPSIRKSLHFSVAL